MWFLNLSRSSDEYIPLVAKAAGLTYFHLGLVNGLIIGGGRASMGRGIFQNQVSCIRNMVGSSSLHSRCVLLLSRIRDLGERK